VDVTNAIAGLGGVKTEKDDRLQLNSTPMLDTALFPYGFERYFTENPSHKRFSALVSS